MSKALELIRTLIDGANEYEKKTGNKNPTVYLSKNNLLVIEKALLKAQEPKQYVDELKLVENKLKALEIIKEKRIDIESFYSSFIESDYDYDYNFYEIRYGTYGKYCLTEEEFNLLKEILKC